MLPSEISPTAVGAVDARTMDDVYAEMRSITHDTTVSLRDRISAAAVLLTAGQSIADVAADLVRVSHRVSDLLFADRAFRAGCDMTTAQRERFIAQARGLDANVEMKPAVRKLCRKVLDALGVALPGESSPGE